MAKKLVSTWTVTPGRDTVEVRRAVMHKRFGYTCDCDVFSPLYCACGGRCGCHQDYVLADGGVVLDGVPRPMWVGNPDEVWEYRKKRVAELLRSGAFLGWGKSLLVSAEFLRAFRALPGES